MDPDSLLLPQMLVCASGSLYWIGVIVLAAVIRRRTRRPANLVPRGGSERELWFGWMIVSVGWIGQPLVVANFVQGRVFTIIPARYQLAALVAGTLLVVAGQLGTYWCYWAMGDSWRIGVSRKKARRLVTRGPYARVRHPIYGFQSLMLVGAACLLPTLMSVFLVALQLVCSYFKSMDEERYLTESLGSQYVSYQARTGWVWPRILNSISDRISSD